ncbi:MAG: putative phage abortive infection protein [Tannerellaceae bacterium]|nr:putative phage abortive infection protein [Tannerellaceae bacterium]
MYIQYREDKKDKEKDNIENRFFQLLELHSKNVERIEAKRQNSFIEYTRILNSILKEIERNKKEGWTDVDMFKLAYLYFFYGFRNMEDQPLTFPSIQKNDIQEINKKLKVKKLSYSGVYLELGIYFRQLYQIVDFINEKTVLSKDEKYNYIRLLRVQLNIYEQYMLFFE